MVYRIEVHPRPGFEDPRSRAALQDALLLGLDRPPRTIEYSSVYLIEGDLSADQIQLLADELLADPVTQTAHLGSSPARADRIIEVHPQPGVMDPDAEAVQQAIRAMLGVDVRVRTGRRYDMHGTDAASARTISERLLANTVIHDIHESPYEPASFPAGSRYELKIVEVPLIDLDDEQLARLSREAHLFLSLDEMRAIQNEYKRLGRNPREIELETLAQTWSEHCVHKTLKATIRYEQADASRLSVKDLKDRPGHELNDDGSITIHNLLKSTIAAATHELIADGVDWCLSIFEDNAGIIAFDDDHAVCFKVETHNHPSAIEPYGGAATGIGGCIRDIIGTGLAAKPIANTDVFCVAPPEHFSRADDSLPAGCLHPKRILTQVVAGVRDYGNRMGIPTLNGAVWFDDRYVGNPLVYCGCVGVMPRDKVFGDPKAGDIIVALGGRTGRDGIHGATFSSAELTDTHADEFGHAVQIGNPVTEKKLLDAILDARDHESGCLYDAITDCGAGGFSSAVGEMGEKLGAQVHLERAPLKYEGLSPTEIWISEAQERMVLAVPPGKVNTLRAICDLHDVEMCELGTFGTHSKELLLRYNGTEIGRLSMSFLHDCLPEVVREAKWPPRSANSLHNQKITKAGKDEPDIGESLLALLAHPNIASKHWIIRQYDHEVQGATVIKPLIGARGEGPSDAAVIQPVSSSRQGLAIANGLATGLEDDPYEMALAAIDECVRNLVCVGADPSRIAILDNFCWPGCDDPQQLGALVRAAEGCYDAAKAYRVPFISGKDSLNNQFTTEDGRTIRIPPTLLISGIGIVPDVRKCMTMDAKRAGNWLVFIGGPETAEQYTLRGSHYERMYGLSARESLPQLNLQREPQTARLIFELISREVVEAVHDVSDGGMLCAAAEMCIAGNLGLHSLKDCCFESLMLFSELPGRYLIEVPQSNMKELERMAGDEVMHHPIGALTDEPMFEVPYMRSSIELTDLQAAWLGTLDW